MRVGTSSGFERVTQQLNRLQGEADALQAQISTGRRLQTAADAPIDAAKVSVLARSLAEHGQAARNLDSAATRLTLGDGALATAANLLDRAREVALAATTDTASPADRTSAAAELAQLSDELLAAANAREPGGDWLFAGGASRAPAYARDVTGAVTWRGAGQPPLIPIAEGRTVAAGDAGPAVFEGVPTASGPATAFELIDSLRAALADGTLTAAARRIAIDRSLDGLSAASDKVGDARARFGARLAAIDRERERLASADLDLTADRGHLEDTDVAAASVSLSRVELLLQATRDTFAKVRTLSLFDSLR